MTENIRKKRPVFPPWIRRPWPTSGGVDEVRDILRRHRLNTVCRGAQCPNQGECWSRGTATFMILGAVCTRNCAFCGVPPGQPQAPDLEEPDRIAEAVRELGLRHVVITSVTRDDLADGGASQFCAAIRSIRAMCSGATVEVLTPDFGGDRAALELVAGSAPEVFAHNIETVKRLHGKLRDPHASYDRSLWVLEQMRALLPDRCQVKSGFMVGCGETEAEVVDALKDLRRAGCSAVTIGQYLQPSGSSLAVDAFVPPEQFQAYERIALELGFSFALAGPFVRSSYHAEALLECGGAARTP